LRYRSRPETVLQYQSDPRTAITVVDLRVGYRLLGTGLQLKISNLLQAHYTNVQERIPGAPRNVSLTAYRGF
jgi:outer membrane receptor for ferric coprogen and ferric-rhodotorulic acid